MRAEDLRVAAWGRDEGPPPAIDCESVDDFEVPPLAYLCGPPAMIDAVADTLKRPWEEGGVGLPDECVIYEKWW